MGAIGAALLLFAATACGSEANDSADSSPAATAAETTVGGTRAPSTDGPGDTTSPPDGTTIDADDPAPTTPPVFVPEALQFTAPLVGGGTFDGAAAAGKPTVFWFWAPT